MVLRLRHEKSSIHMVMRAVVGNAPATIVARLRKDVDMILTVAMRHGYATVRQFYRLRTTFLPVELTFVAEIPEVA